MKASTQKKVLVSTALLLLVTTGGLWYLDRHTPLVANDAKYKTKNKVDAKNAVNDATRPIAPKRQAANALPSTENINSVDIPHLKKPPRVVAGNSDKFKDIQGLSPLSSMSEPEQADARARATKAAMLNQRLEEKLQILRAHRDNTTGTEREELDRAIQLFERNLDRRTNLETQDLLPTRN